MQNRERRQNSKISNEVRGLIINAMHRGLSSVDVGRQFNVKPNTIRKIYGKNLRTGQINKQSAGHRRQVLTPQQKEIICDWIDEDCTLTLSSIKQKCLNQWPGIQISISTVNRALKEFHYSMKRVTCVPERRNTPEVIQSRFNFAIQYNRIMHEREKIFFIDEFGVQVFSRVSSGRSVRNTPAHVTKAQVRGRNHSIAAAMNCNSLYLFQIQDVPYNVNHFSEYLITLINHLHNDDIIGAYFLMDNVSFHRSVEIVNLIENHGHHCVFIPPYSPFLNPIEELFSQWKNYIRRSAPRNEDELYESVHTSSTHISPANCLNYVQHMETYLADCLQSREILS